MHPTRRAILLAPLLTLPAGGARAHAVLVASIPAANATVPAGQTLFTLHFNTRLEHARSRLTLLATDGLQTVLSIIPAGDPEVLSAVGIVSPGGQALRWQVLAADGHITRGEVPFKALRGEAPRG